MHSPKMSGSGKNSNRKNNNSLPKVSASQVYLNTPNSNKLNITPFNKYSISNIKDNFDSSSNNKNHNKTERQPLKKKQKKLNGLKPIKNIHLIDESY